VTVGGRRYSSEVTSPRGEATNPLSWAELEAKYKAATRFVATEIQQARMITAVNHARAGYAVPLMACLKSMNFPQPA
jgi:2-methylcitrate dehydratase PrpD